MDTKIQRFSDLSSLSKRAAQLVVQAARAAIAHRGWCSIVLSGGTSPKLLYEYLAAPGFSEKIPWDKIHFFWGDERCVSYGHQESNFSLASAALLSKISIPELNIHRMRGEISLPEDSAATYEKELRAFFQSAGDGAALCPLAGNDDPSLCSPVREAGKAVKAHMDRENMFPQFDLVLLGLGADGHTASLFPGDSAVNEKSRWVLAVHAPAGYCPENRITLTLPVINNAQRVFFLVSGKGKTGVAKEVIAQRPGAEKLYPAACVAPRKELVWLIDEGTGA